MSEFSEEFEEYIGWQQPNKVTMDNLANIIRSTHWEMRPKPPIDEGTHSGINFGDRHNYVDEPDPLMFWITMGFWFYFVLLYTIANFNPYLPN